MSACSFDVKLQIGLKRYAQTTIRYDTQYGAHDTIYSAIHLPFLAGKQRLVILACNQKHCTPPITTACAVMMRNGYNNGSFLRVSRCSVFAMNLFVLLEWNILVVICGISCSFLTLVSVTTVPYRIVSLSERIVRAYRSLCIGGIPVCQCILSAPVTNNFDKVKNNKTYTKMSKFSVLLPIFFSSVLCNLTKVYGYSFN